MKIIRNLVPIAFLLCLLGSTQILFARNNSDSVRVRVTYHSQKLGTLELAWGINNWHEPAQALLPHGTIITDEKAYTPMQRKGQDFSTILKLPKGTHLDFFFRSQKNAAGQRHQAFDTNGGDLYGLVAMDDIVYPVKDTLLWLKDKEFNLLFWALKILAAALVLLVVSVLLFRKKSKPGPVHLFPAAWLCGGLITVAARAEIAHTSLFAPKAFFAAIHQDAFLFFCVGVTGTVLLALTDKRKTLQKATSIFLFVLLLLITVISILNIEVIKQLGTPFNYKWLVYSDFLKESDSKKEAAKVLNAWYMGRVSMLILAFLILSKALQYLFAQVAVRRVLPFLMGGALLLTLLLSMNLFGSRNIPASRRETPVWAFARSLFEPANKERILQMELPPQVGQYFTSIAAARTLPKVMDSIDNILVFVSESTPANLVSLYNDGFNATPNLKAWSSKGKIFDNMYAHIPSTGNSMISMVTGTYPTLSFHSALMENVRWQQPSLPMLLNRAGWQTGLFFASDLQYSRMDSFALRQGFNTIRDRNNMHCKVLAEMKDKTLDVIDDACVVNEYQTWLQQHGGKKKMAVLWTNQTHSPYYSDQSKAFTGDKRKLNQYLNALNHSDSLFGALMQSLEKSGTLQNTLVIFTADHGEAFGTHNQHSHASRIYEENVHIPMVLIQPRIFKGERDTLVRNMVDLPATIAQVAGLNKPHGWYGHSLMEQPAENRAFFVSPYTDLLVGTRNKAWKFIYNVDNRDVELYNLQSDPGEKHNIADKFPKVVQEQSQYIFGWMQQVHGYYQRIKPSSK